MRLSFTLAVAFTVLALPLSAQGAQETGSTAIPSPLRDSIMAPIKSLFDGMRTRDTAMMRAAFAPGTLLTQLPRPGQPVKFETVDGFLTSVVSGPPGPSFDEQIYDPEVRVDGALASVWTFYTFTAGTYSHCGIDAFQLVRTTTGWKITALADTRRQQGCAVDGKVKG